MVCVSFHFLTDLRMRSGRVYQTFLQGLEWAVLAIPPTPTPAQCTDCSSLHPPFSHEEMRLRGNSLSLKLKSELVRWPLE